MLARALKGFAGTGLIVSSKCSVTLGLAASASIATMTGGHSSFDCDGSRCHTECELRHLDEYEVKARSVANAESTTNATCQEPQLVICAGPERAGSTWLYNAIRHLHSSVNVPCDSYWIHHLDEKKIEARLQEGRTVFVKTHKYYNDYDSWLYQHNPVIIVTHRDLRDVLISYRRLGWAYDIPQYYVTHHMQWLEHAALDLSFNEIINDNMNTLKKLATKLELPFDDSSILTAKERIDSIKDTHGGVDQVTKHWPSHTGGRKEDKTKFNYLLERFPEFYNLYDDF
jgi:hypothetical protein